MGSNHTGQVVCLGSPEESAAEGKQQADDAQRAVWERIASMHPKEATGSARDVVGCVLLNTLESLCAGGGGR